MGRSKRGLAIDGVVLLDKPLHLSSNDALQKVRRLFNARKGGHTGSLDPLASGLLPICFGEATKLSSYLLSAPKCYEVTASVGFETETGDREGAPSEHSDTAVPERDAFVELLKSFSGAQTQIPPMYSALKVNGKPLYAYARAGETIERAPRAIMVHSLECTARTTDSFALVLTVSGGTYVRTLVEDIARAFGGRAHVAALRRTGVGPLGRDLPMVTLAALEEAAGDSRNDWLHSLDLLVSDWPSVSLDCDQTTAIGYGQRIACPPVKGDVSPDSLLRIDSQDAGMIGVGFIDEQGRLAPKRLFSSASK